MTTSTTSLKKNAILAIINVIIASIVLFFTYKYLLDKLGAEKVGIWAVVMASVASAKLSEFGLSASIVKYVAKYISYNDKNNAAKVVDTTLVTITVLITLFTLIFYPIIVYFLEKFIDPTAYQDAVKLLPYAFASIFISSLAGCFASGLDGIVRMDLRIYATIISLITFAFLTFLLVPLYGLNGVAQAQVAQGLVMLVMTFLYLKKRLPLKVFRWDYNTLKEMINYGVNFQIIMIFYILAEPATKILMAKFGGLTSTAYYEMASRLVAQLRLIAVSANQVIIPKIAMLSEKKVSHGIVDAYFLSYRLMWAFSALIFSSIILSSSMISIVWIGEENLVFVDYLLFISLCQWYNSLTVPSYFISLGTGKLKWNTLGHVVYGCLNVILSYLFGLYLGAQGVVLGFTIALTIGSSVIIYGFHSENKIKMKRLHTNEEYGIILITLIVIIISYFCVSYYSFDTMFKIILNVLCVSLVTFSLLLNSTIRNFLIDFLKKE